MLFFFGNEYVLQEAERKNGKTYFHRRLNPFLNHRKCKNFGHFWPILTILHLLNKILKALRGGPPSNEESRMIALQRNVNQSLEISTSAFLVVVRVWINIYKYIFFTYYLYIHSMYHTQSCPKFQVYIRLFTDIAELELSILQSSPKWTKF